jgi:NAD(P)-dependent dehydrogenase (short-subunit alcohol dehydrogenase family)
VNKVAMVTGASAGIGEPTVKRLIEQGSTTYAAARRLDRMASLEELGAKLLPLDLTDDGSIVQAAERIPTEQGRIDVLVNNAGYGSYEQWKRSHSSAAAVRGECFRPGPARPAFDAAHAAAAVGKDSKRVVGGRQGREPMGDWYHATKFAVEGFSDCLRMELKPFGIAVVVIEPGAIRTEWGQIALDTLQQASGQTVHVLQSEEKRAIVPRRRRFRVGSCGRGSQDRQGYSGRSPKDALRRRRLCEADGIHIDLSCPTVNDWFMAAISKSLLKWQRKASATETPQGI